MGDGWEWGDADTERARSVWYMVREGQGVHGGGGSRAVLSQSRGLEGLKRSGASGDRGGVQLMWAPDTRGKRATSELIRTFARPRGGFGGGAG